MRELGVQHLLAFLTRGMRWAGINGLEMANSISHRLLSHYTSCRRMIGNHSGEEVMKTRYTIAFSMIAGATLGVTALQALHAQTKPKAYNIVENVINDQNGYMKDCAPAMAKSNEDAGSKFLVRGGQVIAVHGAPPSERVVVVQFDSLDKAQAWVNSPATKALIAQCEKHATLHDYLVEGVPQ